MLHSLLSRSPGESTSSLRASVSLHCLLEVLVFGGRRASGVDWTPSNSSVVLGWDGVPVTKLSLACGHGQMDAPRDSLIALGVGNGGQGALSAHSRDEAGGEGRAPEEGLGGGPPQQGLGPGRTGL